MIIIMMLRFFIILGPTGQLYLSAVLPQELREGRGIDSRRAQKKYYYFGTVQPVQLGYVHSLF